MLNLGSIPERLARNRYVLDEGTSHIEVDQAVVRSTGTGDLLVRVCPAHVYSRAPDGSIVVQHAACLECGACLAVAAPGSLRWHYPRGGFGVVYREG
jgi:ferredoxin like protein